MQLFIVGLIREPDTAPGEWEFVGVFDSQSSAEAEAKEWNYFVAPCWLNEPAPQEHSPWPGAYYPKAAER